MPRIWGTGLAGGEGSWADPWTRAHAGAGAWRVGGLRRAAHLPRKGTGVERVAFYLRDLPSYPEINSWQSQGLSRKPEQDFRT